MRRLLLFLNWLLYSILASDRAKIQTRMKTERELPIIRQMGGCDVVKDSFYFSWVHVIVNGQLPLYIRGYLSSFFFVDFLTLIP